MKKLFIPLREKIQKRFFSESDTPLTIYITVAVALVLAFSIKTYHEDLSLNLFSELIGAAFTLFVIDVLLVKTKTKRWRVVQKHIDYLIARTVNRLRDGLSTRAFSFNPLFKSGGAEEDKSQQIRAQREMFLNELAALSPKELAGRLNTELFSQENYAYFNEKAEDIWSLLNMKYSEYLAPQLVSLLIELHTNLKDVCSQIRIYKKGERFPAEETYYQAAGRKGTARHLKEIIRIVNELKKEGYSETARKMA